jgi:hypothetical protein
MGKGEMLTQFYSVYLKGRDYFRGPRHRCESNIIVNVNEIWYEDIEWINFVQDRDSQFSDWLRAGRSVVGGFDSRRGLEIFLFTTASRTALGPTQPPIQWVTESSFRRSKAAEA